VIVVDAANVVGSRPTGWWRDRPGAAADLVARIRAAVAGGRLPAPVVVVLEGAARAGAAQGEASGVTVVHAGGSGDDAVVGCCRAAAGTVVLVSADRALRRRVAPAEALGPSWLLARLQPAP
jgi:hypothetical protein